MKSAIPLSVLLLAGLLPDCSHSEKPVRNAGHPNVLFLFADDQRADALGCAGNHDLKTPSIDKLAKTGVRFSNAYIMGGNQGAICAPSRAMLMSGKSLFHVYDKLDGVHTMPMHFAEHGYLTFATGKWHNEKTAFEASFQQGRNVFLGGMADHFSIPLRDMGSDGKLTKPENKGFSTNLFAGAAMDFLNEYAAGNREKPFFCYVAFTVPHDPYSPHPDYIDRYSGQSLPLPPNFMPLHPFRFDQLDIRDENLLPWPRTPDGVRAALADYYALITHLDDKVGQILETLKKLQLHDNTIVVYAADNGLAIGSHGLLGKQNLYEHSVKVPLIIHGPGIPQNQVREALVYLYDLFPTLSGLCGLPSPDGVDGKNIVPVIKGDSAGVRTSVYMAYRNTARAVRSGDWKLILYPQRNFKQLFNLKEDPDEMNNLAAQSGYEVKAGEMMDLLKDWYVLMDDTAALTPERILPLEYDYSKLQQNPDVHQPEYVLKKYFKGIDVKKGTEK